MTLTLRQSVLLRRSPHEVFAYVSDFNRAKEWRVEVRESTQTPPGPMVKGSRLHEESAIMGRRVVTESVVDELEPGRRFTFRHVAGPIPVGGEYLVEEVVDGTRLTYTLNAELRGVWGVAAPYLRRSGPRMMARSLETLRARLDS
jgi:Polyketide cyclase / dehydrase and lipid transport